MLQNVLYRMQRDWGRPGTVVHNITSTVDPTTGSISRNALRLDLMAIVILPWDVFVSSFRLSVQSITFERCSSVAIVDTGDIPQGISLQMGDKVIFPERTYEIKKVTTNINMYILQLEETQAR